MPIKDLTNKKFERLTVKEIVYERDPDGRVQWDCLCKCGNWKRTTGHALKQKFVKSCGCLKKESSSRKAKKLNNSGRNKHPKAKDLLKEIYQQFKCNSRIEQETFEKLKLFVEK